MSSLPPTGGDSRVTQFLRDAYISALTWIGNKLDKLNKKSNDIALTTLKDSSVQQKDVFSATTNVIDPNLATKATDVAKQMTNPTCKTVISPVPDYHADWSYQKVNNDAYSEKIELIQKDLKNKPIGEFFLIKMPSKGPNEPTLIQLALKTHETTSDHDWGISYFNIVESKDGTCYIPETSPQLRHILNKKNFKSLDEIRNGLNEAYSASNKTETQKIREEIPTVLEQETPVIFDRDSPETPKNLVSQETADQPVSPPNLLNELKIPYIIKGTSFTESQLNSPTKMKELLLPNDGQYLYAVTSTLNHVILILNNNGKIEKHNIDAQDHNTCHFLKDDALLSKDLKFDNLNLFDDYLKTNLKTSSGAKLTPFTEEIVSPSLEKKEHADDEVSTSIKEELRNLTPGKYASFKPNSRNVVITIENEGNKRQIQFSKEGKSFKVKEDSDTPEYLKNKKFNNKIDLEKSLKLNEPNAKINFEEQKKDFIIVFQTKNNIPLRLQFYYDNDRVKLHTNTQDVPEILKNASFENEEKLNEFFEVNHEILLNFTPKTSLTYQPDLSDLTRTLRYQEQRKGFSSIPDILPDVNKPISG